MKVFAALEHLQFTVHGAKWAGRDVTCRGSKVISYVGVVVWRQRVSRDHRTRSGGKGEEEEELTIRTRREEPTAGGTCGRESVSLELLPGSPRSPVPERSVNSGHVNISQV
ncbi:unnamed protein product [Pleuronectes platessa]|uniref:Uncharacterized protein n=1 Tax=Pleuronectes platessa TaxID=8262 RepID=A0A9N7U9Y6_PLEPL|nr:unnamed protein product [Pleuronectes platessa]